MTNSTEVKNITPEHNQHLISEQGLDFITTQGLSVHIEPMEDCQPIHSFPFAAMFDQIPNPYEYGAGSVNNQTFTLIKADEVGATDDETALNALTRLGCDLDSTCYWLVYAYELETPNEKGLTKLLTANLSELPANGAKFAGFGYQSTKKANLLTDDEYHAWAIAEKERLMGSLYPVSLWLNDKLMTVTVRDAEDGLYITQYDCGSDTGAVDRKLLWKDAGWVAKHKSTPEYLKRKAELAAGTHILADGHENLLSEETKALLANEGLRVKVYDLPKTDDYGRYLCNKLFTVADYYPTNELADSSLNSERRDVIRDVIRDEDFGATIAETAQNLMARMEQGDEGMSYWAIYQYESEVPNLYGHTTIYTTDITDAPAGSANLAGIAISYNLYMTPTPDVEEEWQTRQRLAREKRIGGLSADDKAAALADWQENQLSSLNGSIFNLEVFVNKKLLDVDFFHISNGDSCRTYDYEPYPKDADEFNTKVQAVIANLKDIKENEATHLKNYLRNINAA